MFYIKKTNLVLKILEDSFQSGGGPIFLDTVFHRLPHSGHIQTLALTGVDLQVWFFYTFLFSLVPLVYLSLKEMVPSCFL